MKRLAPTVAAVLVVAATLGPLALAVRPAAAEHQLWYRYLVLGYVKDAHGKPVRGRQIEVVRDKTGFSYLGDTDARGFYLVITRLGDESAGETLTLKVGSTTRRIVARFDPANHTDDRGTRVDVEGAKLVERPAWFRSSLAQYLGSAAR